MKSTEITNLNKRKSSPMKLLVVKLLWTCLAFPAVSVLMFLIMIHELSGALLLGLIFAGAHSICIIALIIEYQIAHLPDGVKADLEQVPIYAKSRAVSIVRGTLSPKFTKVFLTFSVIISLVLEIFGCAAWTSYIVLFLLALVKTVGIIWIYKLTHM